MSNQEIALMAHLMRRAGFGASRDELEARVEMGYEASNPGRRIRDNGSGTDHGAGGLAMLIGGSVNGGMYGEVPSLEEAHQLDGDLRANNDFRSTYSTILERWLGLDAPSIVNGQFEHLEFIEK